MAEQTETEKTIFKELFRVDTEDPTRTPLIIQELSRNDTIVSYYLEQSKDGVKKGITLKKSDFGKLFPIFKEISLK